MKYNLKFKSKSSKLQEKTKNIFYLLSCPARAGSPAKRGDCFEFYALSFKLILRVWRNNLPAVALR
jgi:hypothetical protein